MCDGKNGSLFPMFGTCRGYYICDNGNAVVGSCDKNSRFDAKTLRCENADKVECTYDILAEYNKGETDSSEIDQSEVDDDAAEIIQIPSTTIEQSPSKDVPSSSSVNSLCLGKKNGFLLSKPGSCTEYYECKSKRPQLRQCQGSQHFSPSHHVCMKKSEANCSLDRNVQPPERPTVTAGLCSDEKQDSLVPHRNDCGKFMLCSNMMFLVMDCPTGLHFNSETRRCDYPKIAKCNIGKKAYKKSNRRRLMKKGQRNTL